MSLQEKGFRFYLTKNGKGLWLKPIVQEHFYPEAIDCTDMSDKELLDLAEELAA